LKFVARAEAFGGTEHYPPIVRGIFFEQKEFDRAAGARLNSAKAGGDYFGIVEDEKVAGVEEIGKIFEKSM
jgi:hypothetical protein